MLLELVCSQASEALIPLQDFDVIGPYDPDKGCLSRYSDLPFLINGQCRSCAYVNEEYPIWTGTKCIPCSQLNRKTKYWYGVICVNKCPENAPR